MLPTAARDGAISFDAPGAQYTHRDGLCSFEVLIADHHLTDPALPLMAQIVHGADNDEGIDTTPQSAGLLAISHGFAMLDLTDAQQLELELPVYDALYAWCSRRSRARSQPERSR